MRRLKYQSSNLPSIIIPKAAFFIIDSDTYILTLVMLNINDLMLYVPVNNISDMMREFSWPLG